jgi:hypothetical protein
MPNRISMGLPFFRAASLAMRGIFRPLAVWDFAKAYLDAFSFLRTRDSGAEAITVVSQVPVDAAAGVDEVVIIFVFC